jgi:hypothetical protein
MLRKFDATNKPRKVGKLAPSSASSFGLPDSQWHQVEEFTRSLPWDFPMGTLSESDVNNCLADQALLKKQLAHWQKYGALQEANLETYNDIQAEKLKTAKAVLAARATAAGTDLKLNEAVYVHQGKMEVLGAQNANAQALEALRAELGIGLEHHRYQNSRSLLDTEFGQKRGLNDVQTQHKRKTILERYQQLRGNVADPQQNEPKYQATPGRVFRFERRTA